jgi:hypothetical protein
MKLLKALLLGLILPIALLGQTHKLQSQWKPPKQSKKVVPNDLPDLSGLWGKGQLTRVRGQLEPRGLAFFETRVVQLPVEEAKREQVFQNLPDPLPEPCRTYLVEGRSIFRSSSSRFRMAVLQTKQEVRAWNQLARVGDPGVVKEDVDGEIFFAFPKEAVNLVPLLAEGFQPTEFKAVAYSGAAIVKTLNNQRVIFHPLGVDGVLAYASDGLGRCKGVFKLPGWDFAVPLEGVQFRGETYFEAEEARPLSAHWVVVPNRFDDIQGGLVGIRPYEPSWLRIKLTASGLDLSFYMKSGGPFDWTSDLHDASYGSVHADASQLKSLPDLEALHKERWSSRAWLQGDGEASFLDQADRAIAKAGLVVNLPQFYQSKIESDEGRRAAAAAGTLRRRVQAFGMKTVSWTGPKR